MTTTIRTRLACVGFVATLGLAAPVFAQSVYDDGVRKQTVSYADLDLSKTAGMNTATHRIHAAAENVCGPDSQPMPLSARAAYDKCMHAAVSDAMNTVKASLALANADKAPKAVELAAASPIR